MWNVRGFYFGFCSLSLDERSPAFRVHLQPFTHQHQWRRRFKGSARALFIQDGTGDDTREINETQRSNGGWRKSSLFSRRSLYYRGGGLRQVCLRENKTVRPASVARLYPPPPHTHIHTHTHSATRSRYVKKRAPPPPPPRHSRALTNITYLPRRPKLPLYGYVNERPRPTKTTGLTRFFPSFYY